MCAEGIHYPPEAIFDAVCTPTYRGCTFQVPTKITYAYSYGAGFVDPQHSQTTFADVQMISPLEVEVENSDDENDHLFDSPPSSPRHNHIRVEEELDATVSMPLTPAEFLNEGVRPRAAEVPPFLATQPVAPPGDVETEFSSSAEDQRYDEDGGCPSQPYIPSLPHVSDDERDDAIVSMQLLAGSPTPTPNAGPILPPGLDGLEEDEEPSQCPGSPSYVPESPTLTPSSGISDGFTEGPTRSLSPSEDHALFDGDSTQFLKWLDGVVHENGRVPSFINGIELPLEERKSLSQWLDQYRAWRTTVQCPDPPLQSSRKASKRRADAVSGSVPRRRRVTRDHRHTGQAEHQQGVFKTPKNQNTSEVPVTDQRLTLLSRILDKCDAEGVELSEALCLFQGRLSGMCAMLDQLIHKMEGDEA